MDKVRFLMSDTGAPFTAACREALEADVEQHGAAHQKQVAEDSLDQQAAGIAHQAFRVADILPLAAGQDLFKTVEVLEAGQQWLTGQSSPTGIKGDALLAVR